MRYNRDTERSIQLEAINRQCWQAVERSQAQFQAAPAPARVWNCQTGGWTTPIR